MKSFCLLFLICWISVVRSEEIKGKFLETEGYNSKIIKIEEDSFIVFHQKENGLYARFQTTQSQTNNQEFTIFKNEENKFFIDYDVTEIVWIEGEGKIYVVISFEDYTDGTTANPFNHKMIWKRLNLDVSLNTITTSEISIDGEYAYEETGLVYQPSITFLKKNETQTEESLYFTFIWESKNKGNNLLYLNSFVMILKDTYLTKKMQFLSKSSEYPFFPVVSKSDNHFIFTYTYQTSYVKSLLYDLEGNYKSEQKIIYVQEITNIKSNAKGNIFIVAFTDISCKTTVVKYYIEGNFLSKDTNEYENAINVDVRLFIKDDNNGFFLIYYEEETVNSINFAFQEESSRDFYIYESYQSPDLYYSNPTLFSTNDKEGNLETQYIFFETFNSDTNASFIIGVKKEFGEVCGEGEYKNEDIVNSLGINFCLACAEGSYKDFEGNEECKECPIYSTNEITGATSISQCLCKADTYMNSNECKSCPDGRLTNDIEGAKSVNECYCPYGETLIGASCIDSMTVTISVVGIGIIGFLVIAFIVSFVIFLIIFIVCVGKFKKKANRFDHIEGVDMILKEAELDQLDKTVPTIKVKESSYIIEYKEIKIIKKIGQGASSSVVYLADWKGIKCAFKGFSEGSSLVGNDNTTFDEFEKEVAICVGLSHPSILQFYGASITPRRIGLLLQYCSNGDLNSFLKNYLKEKNTKYPTKEKVRILKEIVSGMEYLHGRKLVHRDLKPENVLLDENEKAKIMDFGLSKTIDNAADKTMTKMIGTVYYMSPEVIEGINYSFPCDVYSWGIMAYVIITEIFFPYGMKISQPAIMGKVSVDPNYRPEINEEQFKDCEFLIPIIKKCWNFSPEKRYTFTKLKEILSNEK